MTAPPLHPTGPPAERAASCVLAACSVGLLSLPPCLRGSEQHGAPDGKDPGLALCHSGAAGTALRRAVGRALLVLAWVLLPAAWAGRFVRVENPAPNPVGSGARALGQGNAFIAVADDATAASWNPGGLTQLERPELSLALEAVHLHERNAAFAPLTEQSQGLTLQDLNYASFVLPVYWKRHMVLSLNFLKQYRFRKEMSFGYSKPFANNLLEIDRYEFSQRGGLSVLAPAFAIDLTPRLSLGLALNIWDDSVTQSSHYVKRQLHAGTFTGPDPPAPFSFLETEVEHFRVDRGRSLTLGAMVRPSKQWTLGATVKPRFTLDLDREYRDVQRLDGAIYVAPPEDSVADLHFPTIIGAGFAWRPSDPLTLSADVTWTQWSDYMLAENSRETNPLTGGTVTTDELDDTFTVRMGAEYLIIRDRYLVPLRCGVGYDPLPAVGGTDDCYTVSAGTGLQVGRFMFDVAYELRWGNEVNGDLLRGFGASQDVRRHRVLASLIVYF